MGRILMIGAGGVATVAAFKIAQNADVFTEFMIASRRKEKCDQIVDAIHKAGHTMDIKTAQVVLPWLTWAMMATFLNLLFCNGKSPFLMADSISWRIFCTNLCIIGSQKAECKGFSAFFTGCIDIFPIQV